MEIVASFVQVYPDRIIIPGFQVLSCPWGHVAEDYIKNIEKSTRISMRYFAINVLPPSLTQYEWVILDHPKVSVKCDVMTLFIEKDSLRTGLYYNVSFLVADKEIYVRRAEKKVRFYTILDETKYYIGTRSDPEAGLPVFTLTLTETPEEAVMYGPQNNVRYSGSFLFQGKKKDLTIDLIATLLPENMAVLSTPTPFLFGGIPTTYYVAVIDGQLTYIENDESFQWNMEIV